MFDFDRRRPRLSTGTVVHTGPTPSTATRPSDENDDATDDSTDTLSDDVPTRQDADGRQLTSPAFEEVFRYGN